MSKETDLLAEMADTFEMAEQLSVALADLFRRASGAARERDGAKVISIITMIEIATGRRIFDADDQRAIRRAVNKERGNEH